MSSKFRLALLPAIAFLLAYLYITATDKTLFVASACFGAATGYVFDRLYRRYRRSAEVIEVRKKYV